MKVTIEFQTQYVYQEVVSLSVHLYRLFPRAGRSVVVQEAAFQTNADARVSYQRDLFDNEVASCFHPEKTAVLQTSLRLGLQVIERDPFDFLLARHALEFPFAYQPDEARVLAPFLQGTTATVPAFWLPSAGSHPTMEALVGINQAFHKNLRYERREEGAARTPEETLMTRGGACRDFSVLLAATLRKFGLATRIVSGYIVETGDLEKRAEGALHAWTEAYLPGAGWLGLDPTNGTVCDHRHIATAVGLEPEHVAPTEGRYFHPQVVGSKMTSTLHVEADA